MKVIYFTVESAGSILRGDLAPKARWSCCIYYNVLGVRLRLAKLIRTSFTGRMDDSMRQQ